MVQKVIDTTLIVPSEQIDFGKALQLDKPIDHPRIEDLRQTLLKYAQEHPNDFQNADIEMIRTTSLWLNRFLNCRGQTFEQATRHAIDTYKWRKQFEVGTVDLSIVPLEGWLSGAMFIYLPDRDNSPVMYLRARMHYRVEPQFYKLLQQLIVYNFTYLDLTVNREFGWTVLLDLTGIGWANVDLEMLHFLVTTMRNHFPNGCRRIIVYGLPWFLNVLAKTIVSALPSDTVAKIKFVSGQSLPDPDPIDVVRYQLDFDGICRQQRPIRPDPIKKTDTTSTGSSEESASDSGTSSAGSAESLDVDQHPDPHLSNKAIAKKLQNSELFDFIDRRNLPDFLGGTADVNYRTSPVNAIPAHQILRQRFHYSDAQIAKTLKPFQKIIDQANKFHDTFRKEKYPFEWTSVEQVTSKSHMFLTTHPTRAIHKVSSTTSTDSSSSTDSPTLQP